MNWKNVMCLFLVFGLFVPVAHAQQAPVSERLESSDIFPDRADVTILQWSAQDALQWSLVWRSEDGQIFEFSQAQPADGRWTASVENRSTGWSATYAFDLGLTDEALVELDPEWMDGDWVGQLKEWHGKGWVNVTHALTTSDGVSLVMADAGSGDPAHALGVKYGNDPRSKEADAVGVITFLTDLALDGYFRETSQMVVLVKILSGGSLDSADILYGRDGVGEGGSGSGELQGSDPADTPRSSFCNGDPFHYAHDYPDRWDTCTKEHNPHYPSYQIPPHCDSEPGCASCQRRTKQIGACCDCCESQYQEKINCDCWIGGLGGCDVLALNVRSKCLNEGCKVHFEASCPA